MKYYSLLVCFLVLIMLSGCSIDTYDTPFINNLDDITFHSKEQNNAINSYTINGIKHFTQNGILPTGCELVSSKMVLDFFNNEDTSIDLIVETVNKSDFKIENGININCTPDEAFIGSPYNPNSFGCYPPVIIKMMNNLLTDKKAINGTGFDIDYLIKNFINNDVPVLVWTTVDLRETFNGIEWYTNKGEKFTWIAPEHCVVLVGYDYDTNTIIVHDPLKDDGYTSYDMNIFKQRYYEIGSKCIVFNDY